MLDEIARMISLAFERKALSERLEYLQQEIEERTQEFERQTQKLSIVDSYLDKVTQGWEQSKVRLEALRIIVTT